MRKILITIITILLVVLAVVMVKDKVKLGNIEIFGVKEIETQDKKLQNQIELGNTAIKTYNTSVTNLEKSYSNLVKAKEKYEQKVATIAAKNTEEAKLLQNYSIEFLWIQIGLHQKEEGVGLILTPSNSGEDTETDLITGREVDIYDMQFTVTGSYEAITEFIYGIENDSKLGFEIEDFSLNPDTDTNNLVARFKCTGIRIYKDTVNNSSILNNLNSNTNNNSNSNTNNTNSNSNSNTNNTNSNSNNNTNNTNSNSNSNTNNNNSENSESGNNTNNNSTSNNQEQE